MRLLDAIAAYETDDMLSLAASTRKTYHQGLHVIAAHLGAEQETDTLHFSVFINLAKHILVQQYARSTASTYGIITLHLLDYLVREDLCEIAPNDLMKIRKAFADLRPPAEDKQPIVPTREQVHQIVAAAYAAETSAPLKQRNIAFLEILACTGMRIQEIADLRCGQIDLTQGHVVITGKRRKQRSVYLSGPARAALGDYWTVRANAARTSPALAAHADRDGRDAHVMNPIKTHGLRYVFNTLAAAAGVHGLTPHKFRHAFATGLHELTGDIVTVKEALGHSDLRSTMVYTHVNPANVREAVEKLHQL